MKLKWIAIVFLFSLAVASCSQEPDTQEAASKAEAPIADVVVEHPEAANKAAAPIADIAAKYSDKGKVVFQNEHLRVLRFDLDPNDELPPHEGHRRVVYSLSDYELDWATDSEAPSHPSWNTGDIHGHDADIHALKNTGETTASFLVFERLDSPLPSAPMHEEGSELPTGAKTLLDNADFHVLEVELQPGDEQAMHHGGWRAIYALSDYTIEWHEGDRVEQKSWSAGDVHWHEPAPHAAINTGDTRARWLVVGLKN